MAITAFFAALLVPLYIWLSVRVIRSRRSDRVEIGHGDSQELLRRSRVHANFAEYAPLALVLMGLAESVKAPSAGLYLAGLLLLAGRHVHAYALSQTPHILRLRVAGMAMTFACLAISGALCLVFGGLQLIAMP